MRHALPTALALLLAAGAVVYALSIVASDLRRVADELDLVARDMSAMSDDVRSIADDVNAIADALAGGADEDDQQQSTGISGRAHAPRLRDTHVVMRERAHARVDAASAAR